jgi:hypothetical protein
MNPMTKKETQQEQPKSCMVYLKSIKTKSFEISAGKRAKLSQEDIDAMHEEIKAIYFSGESGKNFVIGKSAKGNRWNSLER